jgi:ERCC4-type nuclease
VRAADEDTDSIEFDKNGAPVPFRPKPKKSKPYVPGYRTGGYAIMLALLDIHNVGRQSATKEQICRLAQPHCDASLTLADPGKSYTAFNSMKTLCDKDYVYKNGKPAKFQLTSTGIEMAEKLREVNESRGGQFAASSSSNGGVGSTRRVGGSSAVITAAAAGGAFSSGTAFAAAIGDDSDDDLGETDMSLYVLNPSQHQSISMNGQTSSRNPSTARSSSTRNRRTTEGLLDLDLFSDSASSPSALESRDRSTISSTADIFAALAEEAPAPKRQKNYNRTSKSKSRSATSAYLDSLLEKMDNENPNELDMSMYVLNPSEHQSISLNGQTIINKNTTVNNDCSNSAATTIPKRPNTPFNSNASSVTNSHVSSFARKVMDANDNNEFEDLRLNNSRYRTPATSSILQADPKKKAASNKRKFNVDEYQVDLTSSSLPTFNHTDDAANEDIVSLLSSPESSPVLRPKSAPLTQEEQFLFGDDFDPNKDYFPLSQSRTKQITNETFQFTYLDTEKEPVHHASQAAILIDEASSSLMYLVKFYSSQANHPKVKQIVKQCMEGEFTTGYLPEAYVVSTCPGLPATPVLPLHREEEDSFWPAQQQPLSQTISQASPLPASQPLSISSSQLQDLNSQPFFPSQQPSITDYTDLIEQQEPLECLLPGEYEIVLVLDSREIQMKGNRDYFQESLAAKGIQCITRSIDLGDVIWIARKKTSSSSQASNNPTEELFLDYIIERKRLDDLVSSIKDGRFTEQKTRLKRSGAEKVIYVVEEYNREEAERFGMQAIQTAMSSTQIIDGIYLKRTNNVDETIDYLVSATKLIKRIYANTTLYSIPGHIITRQNYLDLKAAYKCRASSIKKEAFLVSYTLFGQLNSKNGSTSLHEVYLRMLMTIKGCNAERALSLIKVYPTPRALLNAFEGKSPEEAKNLAKEATRNQISRRRWGTQLSEKLYNIWGAFIYPASAHSDSDSDE